jgi:hypothetical protein
MLDYCTVGQRKRTLERRTSSELHKRKRSVAYFFTADMKWDLLSPTIFVAIGMRGLVADSWIRPLDLQSLLDLAFST